MASVQPESKRDPSSRELGPSAETGGGEPDPPDLDEHGLHVGGSPAGGLRVPGMHGGVNTLGRPTSNSKEIRAREAEEDRALIAKAQAGDTAAFRSLVERHQRRAFAIALSLVRDENDARELVQDAFLRVYKGLGTFQGGSSFFTWLYRIVTNLSIDLMRKPGRVAVGSVPGANGSNDLESLSSSHENRADHETDNPDFPLVSRIDGADPVDVLRRKEIGGRIQAALDALPPYHRSVIVMREVEGLSYDEMAQAMGVSKGTIMSRLFHARQKLQKALHDCYAEQIGVHAVGGGGGSAAKAGADAPDEGSPESSDGPESGGTP